MIELWRPIESAPKDGTVIMASSDRTPQGISGAYYVSWWESRDKVGWFDNEGREYRPKWWQSK